MAKVNIKGPIVSSDDAWIYDWFGIENTSPVSVAKQIEAANGGSLEVEINSGGGSVFAGSEIYTALKSYPGNVTVKIVGLAASAASVIAMAGNKVMMTPTGQMMIHNVSGSMRGDYRDMQHEAGILENANKTVANAYMIKTGLKQDELLALMNDETWFTPQQALEKGLIDEIMFADQVQLVASYELSGMLPREVIEKMRNSKAKNPVQNESDFLMQKFNLLKLKGEAHE